MNDDNWFARTPLDVANLDPGRVEQFVFCKNSGGPKQYHEQGGRPGPTQDDGPPTAVTHRRLAESQLQFRGLLA